MNRRDAIKYLSVYRKEALEEGTKRELTTGLKGALGGGVGAAIGSRYGGLAGLQGATQLIRHTRLGSTPSRALGTAMAGSLGGTLLGAGAGGYAGYRLAHKAPSEMDVAKDLVQDNPGKAIAAGALGAAGIATLLYLALKKKKKA